MKKKDYFGCELLSNIEKKHYLGFTQEIDRYFPFQTNEQNIFN